MQRGPQKTPTEWTPQRRNSDRRLDEMPQLRRQALTSLLAISCHATSIGLLDKVIAGEYAIALEIFNNHAAISARKGAPVTWLEMEPALAVLSVAAVLQGAPHPHAGKLFLDFLVSSEGQKIVCEAGEWPVDPNVAPIDPLRDPTTAISGRRTLAPAELGVARPKWTKIDDDIFR